MFKRGLYSSSSSPSLKRPTRAVLGSFQMWTEYQHYRRPQDMTSSFRNNLVTLITIIIMSLHDWFPDSRTRPPGRGTAADVCQTDRFLCKNVFLDLCDSHGKLAHIFGGIPPMFRVTVGIKTQMDTSMTARFTASCLFI